MLGDKKQYKQSHLCLTLLEHAINIISFFRRKSNEYKLFDRININTPYFNAFINPQFFASHLRNLLSATFLRQRSNKT